MLRSLVGSEMCIRDRAWIPHELQAKIALWLDAASTDLNLDPDGAMLSWRCKLRNRTMIPLAQPDYGPPVAVRVGDVDVMRCGYSASMELDQSTQSDGLLTSVHTLISVHCFEDSEAIKAERRSQFYILSGDHQGPFHGGPNEPISGHGQWVSPHAYNGSLRVNGGPSIPVSETSLDNLKKFNVCTLQCADTLSQQSMTQGHRFGKTVNRIGRDRTYHEFSGKLAELIVLSEPIEPTQIIKFENYLRSKWQSVLK
eukprot:TRINITY_DN45344_c0_g1_i4.p1 TRINITY_DN45344_c0_g1~~TRINITY_DN45344_c0_g1_i4.p1  ORF type:complete len:255 (-),score=49.51 TRINITY_DN45344_c0_g1_i4:254-1018(-)